MNTKQLKKQNGKFSDANLTVLYLSRLELLRQKLPTKQLRMRKTTGYNDHEWFYQIIRSSCVGETLIHRAMLWALYLTVPSSSQILRQLCLMDDIVYIISNEKLFRKGLEDNQELLDRLRETRERSFKLPIDSPEFKEINADIDRVESEVKLRYKAESDGYAELQVLKRDHLRRFTTDEETLKTLLADFSYDAIIGDEESDLALAVALRGLLPVGRLARHSSDYDDTFQTVSRLRQKVLKAYGVDKKDILGMLVHFLSAKGA